MEGPPTPYRDGKPLADIIPPDRRRAKLMALVVASMIAGVAVWQLAIYAVDTIGSRGSESLPIAPATPGYAAGRINPAVLHGPGGPVTMPPRARSVVHVWLQGCSDCMPAFEAMRELHESGGLGIDAPVINVSYGQADPVWAASYRVNDNLVYDIGGAAVIKPLGIGTFTSLVVDPDGVIVHRDRPDRPGYRERMRAAAGRDLPPLPASTTPLPASTTFDSDVVQRVVAAHREGIRVRCWQRPENEGLSSANIRVTLVIGTDGEVMNATAVDADTPLSSCILRESKSWRFPPPKERTTVTIPFKFVRQ